jgi:diaminopimelate epimerase
VVSNSYPFLKGHGTENDFVLLPDLDGGVHGQLAPGRVVALCDRRAGIGADGVLRVIRSGAYDDPAAIAAREEAEWFMDYRNSDGSVSEMCGNGIRVFARYLADFQGVDTTQPLAIGTRGGTKVVRFEDDGQITVDMGSPVINAPTKVSIDDRRWAADHVDMGNPHAVVFVDALEEAGSLREEPSYDQAVYPRGVNVEFVVRRGERHVAMRVHERGSGETRSCGTGACAVMVAAALRDGYSGGATGAGRLIRDPMPDGPGVGEGATYRVDVPGGTLEVSWTGADRVLLAGPAVIVAQGVVQGAIEGRPG